MAVVTGCAATALAGAGATASAGFCAAARCGSGLGVSSCDPKTPATAKVPIPAKTGTQGLLQVLAATLGWLRTGVGAALSVSSKLGALTGLGAKPNKEGVSGTRSSSARTTSAPSLFKSFRPSWNLMRWL